MVFHSLRVFKILKKFSFLFPPENLDHLHSASRDLFIPKHGPGPTTQLPCHPTILRVEFLFRKPNSNGIPRTNFWIPRTIFWIPRAIQLQLLNWAKEQSFGRRECDICLLFSNQFDSLFVTNEFLFKSTSSTFLYILLKNRKFFEIKFNVAENSSNIEPIRFIYFTKYFAFINYIFISNSSVSCLVSHKKQSKNFFYPYIIILQKYFTKYYNLFLPCLITKLAYNEFK